MKKVKLKLPKNPEKLYENIDLVFYLDQLEEENKLNILPDALFVYHILRTLYNRIMNDGFDSILYNQNIYFSNYIIDCFSKIENDKLKNILIEYIEISKIYQNTNDEKRINALLDEKIVKLDKKINLLKEFKRIYKELYVENSFINIEIDETENKKFYKWNKEQATLESSLDAFMNYLSKYNNDWDIYVDEFFDIFTIMALSKEVIDFQEIMDNWKKESCYHDILFFKAMFIKKRTDQKRVEIQIHKSGYERDEYVIEREETENLSRMWIYDDYKCCIELGCSNERIALNVNKDWMKDIYEYLKQHMNEYPHIKKVEFDFSRITLSKNIKKLINENKD